MPKQADICEKIPQKIFKKIFVFLLTNILSCCIINKSFDSNTYARVAQLVEHDLAKVGAAGSSPVSRSLKIGGNVDTYSVSVFLCLQI